MFIDGIGISGYRSFGQEVQRIGPFKKINLIIGQNNSGKSNFLRFLKDHYPNIAKGKVPKLEDLDKHIGNPTTENRYEIAIERDGELYKQLMERLGRNRKSFQQAIDYIRTILTSDILTQGTELIWFPYITSGGHLVMDERIFREFHDANIFHADIWKHTWEILTGQGRGDILQHWIPDTLKMLSPLNLFKISVSFIPAIREIIDGEGNLDNELMSGKGLIKQLAKLKGPRLDKLQHKKQFEKYLSSGTLKNKHK